jgi:hypothetical protein
MTDLDVKTNSFGFKYFEPVKGHFANGMAVAGSIEVAESSCAFPASIHVETHADLPRLSVASIQLDLEAATLLRDQLTWLIENHYQVKPRELPPEIAEMVAEMARKDARGGTGVFDE